MDGTILTNGEFSFSFNGKEYQVKRANLTKVIEFQRRSKDIANEQDAGGDLRLAAYAIYLILKDQDSSITEDSVLQDCPGDIDVIDLLTMLGFMSRSKVEAMSRLRILPASSKPSPETTKA